MTGSELVAEVQLIVQDASYQTAAILKYLNEGLAWVAYRVDIPALEEIDTVTTDTSADNVALPDNYLRDLKYVNSVTNEVRITLPRRATEYLKFRRRNPFSTSGERVTDVGVRNHKLFYYPTPTAEETLQLAFYGKPAEIIAASEPTELPEYLQRRILCSYAAWVIFAQIEDGLEGPQPNTDRQWNNFLGAVGDLRDCIGDVDSEPGYIADDYNPDEHNY